MSGQSLSGILSILPLLEFTRLPSTLTSLSAIYIISLSTPHLTPFLPMLSFFPVIFLLNQSTRTCQAFAGNLSPFFLTFVSIANPCWSLALLLAVFGGLVLRSSARNLFPMQTSRQSLTASLPLLHTMISSFVLSSTHSCALASWFFQISVTFVTTGNSLYITPFKSPSSHLNSPSFCPPTKVTGLSRATLSLFNKPTPPLTLIHLSLCTSTQGMLFFFTSGALAYLPCFCSHAALVSFEVACFVPQHYAGHSIRSGSATSLAEAGVDFSLIQAIGRWSSTAFAFTSEKIPFSYMLPSLAALPTSHSIRLLFFSFSFFCSFPFHRCALFFFSYFFPSCQNSFSPISYLKQKKNPFFLYSLLYSVTYSHKIGFGLPRWASATCRVAFWLHLRPF